MANVLALFAVDDILGDVAGMVGHPLQRKNRVVGLLYGAGVEPPPNETAGTGAVPAAGPGIFFV